MYHTVLTQALDHLLGGFSKLPAYSQGLRYLCMLGIEVPVFDTEKILFLFLKKKNRLLVCRHMFHGACGGQMTL